MSKLWKVKEVSEYLRLSQKQIYAMVTEGRIASIRMGGSVRIAEDNVKSYLQSCRRGGPEAARPAA